MPRTWLSRTLLRSMRHREVVRLVCLTVALHSCAPKADRQRTVKDDSSRRMAARRIAETPLRGDDSDDVRVFSVPRLPAQIDTFHVKRLLGDTSQFARVAQMRVMGHHLIVSDRRTDPHLSILDLTTGKQVGRFGRHGQGPGEFLDPSSITPRRGSDTDWWIYDFNTRRASLVSFANPARPRLLREMLLNVGPSLSNVVFDDSLIVANGLFPDYSLLLLDTLGRPLRRIRGTPPFDSSRGLAPVGLRLTNVNTMALAYDWKRLVLAYQFASQLSFFDLSGRALARAVGPRTMRASFRTDPKSGRFFWSNDNESAYWAVEPADSLVYALYQGRRDFTRPQPIPDRVHVFSWSGEFVREIVLDRPVLTLTVSRDGTRLFGFVQEPYPQIGEWWIGGSTVSLR